jgi:hypothetical protein
MAPGRPLVEKVISLHVWLPNTLGSGSPTLVRAIPGDVAQLVERLLCKQEVAGSNPAGSIGRIPRTTGSHHVAAGTPRPATARVEASWKRGGS